MSLSLTTSKQLFLLKLRADVFVKNNL